MDAACSRAVLRTISARAGDVVCKSTSVRSIASCIGPDGAGALKSPCSATTSSVGRRDLGRRGRPRRTGCCSASVARTVLALRPRSAAPPGCAIRRAPWARRRPRSPHRKRQRPSTRKRLAHRTTAAPEAVPARAIPTRRALPTPAAPHRTRRQSRTPKRRPAKMAAVAARVARQRRRHRPWAGSVSHCCSAQGCCGAAGARQFRFRAGPTINERRVALAVLRRRAALPRQSFGDLGTGDSSLASSPGGWSGATAQGMWARRASY